MAPCHVRATVILHGPVVWKPFLPRYEPRMAPGFWQNFSNAPENLAVLSSFPNVYSARCGSSSRLGRPATDPRSLGSQQQRLCIVSHHLDVDKEACIALPSDFCKLWMWCWCALSMRRLGCVVTRVLLAHTLTLDTKLQAAKDTDGLKIMSNGPW
ncbi:hypothetical protein BS50DRAFT_576696 [Corynespora cassiicola Philippines]|uniref:Uncharacterized protein n=1 Tax=Corynespora cassiicola Philippines TaxID=1448308 RepID=A0A2T2NFN9_CORCC|nr:hypothetical protein BS50DRAFT_576696 [Corynespora cassiicola Philippines]